MSNAAAKQTPLPADDGFISIYDYMQQGNAKYYAARDPLGEAGDFITAPEITQMFGEVLGAWCIARWEQLGKPSPLHLIELGPGRGTLMADLLRISLPYSEFYSALRLHMVETSPLLTQKQQAVLAGYDIPKTWHQNLDTVPLNATLLLANEFFDALPVEHYFMTALGWQQRGVAFTHGQPQFTTRATVPPLLPDNLPAAIPGQIYEYHPDLLPIIEQINARLQAAPGSALIIDYGYGKDSYGESLQAVAAHGMVDILQPWGTVDLTAHVNFAAIKRAAQAAGITAYGPEFQRQFLRAVGLEQRAQNLFDRADADEKMEIFDAMLRLTSPDEMGSLFKVMCLSSPDFPPPEGF